MAERVRATVTDSRGEFSIARLKPGEYAVVATLPGFRTVQTKVVLAAGRTERLTLQMQVGALQETVSVTAESPVIDTQSTLRQSARIAGGIVGGVVGGIPAAGVREAFDTEAYDHIEENRFRSVSVDPLSTFSIDVDTASYANVRRFITDGMLPPAGAIRIEGLVNYFRFEYPQLPANEPFSITTELTPCPWNPRHRLALIGLQGRELTERAPAPRNLVFLIDVSGSMMPPDKLPLVRTAMRMLTDVLAERDRVAIVVYAGASGLVLPQRVHRARRARRAAARSRRFETVAPIADRRV